MHIPSKVTNRLQTFQLHYPLVGPVLWISSLQFFIIMLVVAMAWPTPYSVFDNTISDLGNTACGIYNERFVCSPLHNWFNASLIVLGLTMLSGSSLIYQSFKQSLGSRLGFTFMGLGGIGTMMVGIFAENTISGLHVLGAALPFTLGNLAIVILGYSLNMPKMLRIFTLVTGIVSLAALGFFVTRIYMGLGIGGMERLVAHPQTIWLIVFGLYVSRNRFGKAKL